MASCVTCGSELHPERAEKYDYCMRRECHKQNARGLKILAYGVNKAADQYEVADGRTRAEMAARAHEPGSRAATRPTRRPAGATRPERRTRPTRNSGPAWTASQQDLAVIYNRRGMRPDEIAEKVGLPKQTVIQMLLGARQAATRRSDDPAAPS
jgi:hypothetical protein